MLKLSQQQRKALKAKWQQSNGGLTYRQFRRLVVHRRDHILVPWCGMWLGIELDGYTHS
jgi:hypothetical protein